MSTTVTIPNIQLQLTLEQFIDAVRQLEPMERSQVARALADAELDAEMTQLITEFYSQPPATDVSDDEIVAEVRAVRQNRR